MAEQGIVRVATLVSAAPLLREFGVDPAAVLAGLGLPAETLADAENRIPYRLAAKLLQRCADASGCQHFGLLVGQRATLASLGTLGDLMAHAPSVRSALQSLRLHLHLQTRGGAPTQSVHGGRATLGYAIYQRNIGSTAQAYDHVLAFEFNILRAVCGARWHPDEVCFAHAQAADCEPYRRFFGTSLRFDAANNEIAFDRGWLDREPPYHDAQTHRLLQRNLAVQLLLEPDDWAEQVRRALPTLLLGGRASEAEVAELLTVPPRTLRRRLGQQGTSFRRLKEDVRSELARQLLLDTTMSTTEIAATLSYADASAFTRAFRRWTDAPPAAWRAALQR